MKDRSPSGWHVVLALAAMFTFTIAVVSWSNHRNRSMIDDWGSRHGYTVENVSQLYVSSPFMFWRRKGDAIYQADLVRNGTSRVSYFRCSIWGVSQRWEDGSTDDE